jgi:hypothetical protein
MPWTMHQRWRTCNSTANLPRDDRDILRIGRSVIFSLRIASMNVTKFHLPGVLEPRPRRAGGASASGRVSPTRFASLENLLSKLPQLSWRRLVVGGQERIYEDTGPSLGTISGTGSFGCFAESGSNPFSRAWATARLAWLSEIPPNVERCRSFHPVRRACSMQYRRNRSTNP